MSPSHSSEPLPPEPRVILGDDAQSYSLSPTDGFRFELVAEHDVEVLGPPLAAW